MFRPFGDNGKLKLVSEMCVVSGWRCHRSLNWASHECQLWVVVEGGCGAVRATLPHYPAAVAGRVPGKYGFAGNTDSLCWLIIGIWSCSDGCRAMQ